MLRVFLVMALFAVAQQVGAAEPLFQRYFHSVFSGDLAWMQDLDPEQYANDRVYKNYQARFIERELPEGWADIDDELASEAAVLYRDYWVDGLLAPDTLEARESELARSLQALLVNHGLADLPGEDVYEQLSIALRERGWGFQGGRTPPLQDFMLWRSTEARDYPVTLTDGEQPVRVNMLDDFVSFGWSNFATFGHAGTGGWADKEALYCIRSHYDDLEAERFRIAYLTHEARHFADYSLYPNLSPADLEYRAKLTQLYYAETEGPAYLEEFRGTANADTDAPHPRANYQVLNDLGKKLGRDLFQADDLQGTGWSEVARAALKLLEANSEALNLAGAQKTEGLLVGS